MATNRPAYRLRMYKPVPDEATVLTPAVGAPHSDAFQVASVTGVSGYQPYLDTIRGRHGRIDLLDRKLDIGTLTVTLTDKKLGTTELSRWWTAFFGDSKGRPRGRLPVQIDESLDNGATWARFFTGRLAGSRLLGKGRAVLTLRDEVEASKMAVFVGEPHSSITYAAFPAVCPLGVMGSSFGTQTVVLPVQGTVGASTAGGASQLWWKTVTFHTVFRGLLLTKNLADAVAPSNRIIVGGGLGGPNYAAVPNFSGSARARVKHLSGALNGQTGDYRVGALMTVWSANQQQHVTGFALQALDTGDRNHLAEPAAGVTVEVTLFIDAPMSKDRPLLINDVDPATFLIDLCAGKFGYVYRSPEQLPSGKSYGDVKRSVATNGMSSFVGTRAAMRFVINKRAQLIEWAEENILKPNHWALYTDRQGRLTLVDLRMPMTLAGLSTLTDADVVATQQVEWEHDPNSAITRMEFTYFVDTAVDPMALDKLDPLPAVTPGLIESVEVPLIVLDIGSPDFGDEPYELTVSGYRSFQGELLQNQPRDVFLRQMLVTLAQEFRRPFGWGTTTISPVCRRTAAVTALTPGAVVLVAATAVPDPSTYKRGGTRVCRVLELSEEGSMIRLRLLDLAVNIVASAPTLGVPAQEAGNTYTGITVAVTVNASTEPVEVRYAVTATSVGTVPTDTSPLWTTWGLVRTTSTVTIRNLPAGMRIWVQGRTLPDSTNIEAKLPSPWTNAASPGRVDTASLPAPSAPVVSNITSKTARVSWTNGATDLLTEVLIATPTTDPRVRIATVLPGSTFYDIPDLDASTTYRVEVRHALGPSVSTGVTADFTTAATGTIASAMSAIQILRAL